MLALSLGLVCLLVAVVLLGGITYQEAHRPSSSVRLRFGADVTPQAVTSLLAGIAGLPHSASVRLEVRADERGVVHYLHASTGTIELLRSRLRGSLPSLRLQPVELPGPTQTSWRLGFVGRYPVLQTDAAETTAAALLGAFADLHHGETLALAWVLRPTRRPVLPQRERTRGHANPWFAPAPSTEHLSALRRKYSEPLLRGYALAWTSGALPRGRQLLGRLTAVLRSRQTSWGRLLTRRRSTFSPWVEVWQRGSLLSPSELAGLVAWPIAAPRIPGLTLTSAPQLIPSPRLPRTGRVYAHSDWPGMEGRPLAQPVIGGLSHALVAGPTGSGKSQLLANLIRQDISAGRGCLVLDGKGDLAEAVLTQISAQRERDVVVLDPSSPLPVPGLRVFGKGTDPELTADLVIGIFRDLFHDSWGVLSDKWLRAGLTTLAYDERATLADLPFLFSEASYRRSLVGKLRDPLLLDTWASFEAMSPAERAQQLGSPMTKVAEVVGRRLVRGVLAQVDPALDLRRALARRQIVIVSLAPGRIGTPAARLIGALVIHELFQAVQGRAALPPERRAPFFAYVDEPRVLGDLPVPLDSLFELARGLGVGLTISPQSLTQLPQAVSRAALTNAATICAFKQAADDAQLLARELSGLTAEELQGLGQFEVAVRLGLGPGDVAPVATGKTLALGAPASDPQAIRQASGERYGRSLDAVDEALRERHTTGARQSPSGRSMPPVGRARRPQ